MPEHQLIEKNKIIAERANFDFVSDRSGLSIKELKEVNESELDFIYDKIKELDKRLDINGL